MRIPLTGLNVLGVMWVMLVATLSRAQCEGWLGGHSIPGADGVVRTAISYGGDKPGDRRWLVIGGDFQHVGDLVAPGLAAWDGEQWTTIGRPTGGTVICSTVWNGEMVIGGQFTAVDGVAAHKVARWDGHTWRGMGGLFSGVAGEQASVYSLLVMNGELYAAGFFTGINGILRNSVARWDGAQWHGLGDGVRAADATPGLVLSLSEWNGLVVAGGDFAGAGGVTAGRSNIAAWNGTEWMALGTGVNSYVRSTCVFQGRLYAGGDFGSASGVPVGRLAAWDGNNWSDVGAALADLDQVMSMVVHDDRLIVGGEFAAIAGSWRPSIASYDGESWQALGNGVGGGDPTVRALCVHDGHLVAAGGFLRAGHASAARLARWDGQGWHAYGDGLELWAFDFAEFRGSVYIGTLFGVGRWNGRTWEVVGDGLNGSARVLAVYNDRLVAGGLFSFAGATPANNIASWDGERWSALAGGVDAKVESLCVYQGDLIAGGEFTQAGDVPAARIARWDGAQWHQLGAGVTMGATVSALAEYQGELYIGGRFGSVANLASSCLARWDGAVWRRVGNGAMSAGTFVNPSVREFLVKDGELIVGGCFRTISGVSASKVAIWNGTAFRAMGAGVGNLRDGLYDEVRALAIYHGQLFAGGQFVGPTGVTDIARWDGTVWRPVSGLGAGDSSGAGNIDDLLSFRGELFVSGQFSVAGGRTSEKVARWTDNGVPAFERQPQDVATPAGSDIVLRSTTTIGYESFGPVRYQWERDGVAVMNGAGGASPGGGVVFGATTTELFVAAAEAGDSGGYRLVASNDCGMRTSNDARVAVEEICYADFDGNGVVNSTDFFDFLAAFFNEDARSDFNDDGETNTQDLFDFLAAFFVSC